MYKWKIIMLMNTHHTLIGVFNCDLANSEDVAKRLFNHDNVFTGILNEYENGSLCVRNDAMIAFEILPMKINDVNIERNEKGGVKLNLKEKLEETHD